MSEFAEKLPGYRVDGRELQVNDELNMPCGYIHHWDGDKTVILDGDEFTAEQLRAIADYMEEHNER